jgi:chitinase
LVIGLIASTSAGNAGYYVPAATIKDFIQWMPTQNYTLAGLMFWDSHWDSLNGYASSNAVVEASLDLEK